MIWCSLKSLGPRPLLRARAKRAFATLSLHGPYDRFPNFTGFRDLALRMQRHVSNALAVAEFYKSTQW